MLKVAQQMIDPSQWIANANREPVTNWPPILYVAHPVAARPGERLIRCPMCKVECAIGVWALFGALGYGTGSWVWLGRDERRRRRDLKRNRADITAAFDRKSK